VVSGRRVEGGFRIAVEDDGPGIPEERRAEVLKRGRRLDETMPGSGLGLDIVQDIAEIYGGSLQLNVSSMGGLRVDLELPIAG
jgi:signal transduction histidine kinase